MIQVLVYNRNILWKSETKIKKKCIRLIGIYFKNFILISVFPLLLIVILPDKENTSSACKSAQCIHCMSPHKIIFRSDDSLPSYMYVTVLKSLLWLPCPQCHWWKLHSFNFWTFANTMFYCNSCKNAVWITRPSLKIKKLTAIKGVFKFVTCK